MDTWAAHIFVLYSILLFIWLSLPFYNIHCSCILLDEKTLCIFLVWSFCFTSMFPVRLLWLLLSHPDACLTLCITWTACMPGLSLSLTILEFVQDSCPLHQWCYPYHPPVPLLLLQCSLAGAFDNDLIQ